MSKQAPAKKQKASVKTTETVSDRATVPTGEWPGAWAAYKYSRNAVMFNLWPYVLTLLIPGLISGLIGALDVHPVIDTTVNYAVSVIFTVASTLIIFAAIRHRKVDLETALRQSLSVTAIKTVGLLILVGLILVGSFLFFIIPFFFVAPRVSLALYYLIDKDKGVVESLSLSWEATKGNVGKVYGIFGASFAMALLFITIIGIPFAIYFLVMYSAVPQILYVFLEKHGSHVSKAKKTA